MTLFTASAMPDRGWWHALWPDPARVVRDIGLRNGMTAVDLCCGDGYFTAEMSKRVAGCLYAIDADPEMRARARQQIEQTSAPPCTLVQADAFDLRRVLPCKVDFVLLANTLHGVPDKTALAREVGAVLKAGGVFTVINWHARPREETIVLGEPRGPGTALRMSPEATRRAIEPGGFALDRVVELPPYHYAALFRKKDEGAVPACGG